MRYDSTDLRLFQNKYKIGHLGQGSDFASGSSGTLSVKAGYVGKVGVLNDVTTLFGRVQ
jgi:hypothetical protein